MKKENNLLVIWIIYGFVFITAIDSILRLLVHLIYFTEIKLEFQNDIILYSIPILTIAIYTITTLSILKVIKTTSNSNGIYLTEFSTKTFILLSIISIILNPITNWFSGFFAEFGSNNNYSMTEYLRSYGIMTTCINISRWLILISLVLYFLNKLKKL